MADLSTDDAAAKAAKEEKLASAKKRFEELRKKKKGKKNKSESSAAEVAGSDLEPASPSSKATGTPGTIPVDAPEELAKHVDEGNRSLPAREDLIPVNSTVPPPDQDTSLSPSTTPNAGSASHSRAAPIHVRRVSTSTGLRRPSITGADILRYGNKSPLSPTDLPDIYKKQASTISELTESVESLKSEVERLKEEEKRLSNAVVQKDEATEQLAVIRTELKESIEKSEIAIKLNNEHEDEAKKLRLEVAALTRQLSHLNSQVSQKDKTISDLRLQSSQSSSSQDRESLSAKEDQIENMEMEISKLGGDLEKANKCLVESQAKLTASEREIELLEESQEAISLELGKTKSKLERALESSIADGVAKNSAESLTKSLQIELDAANATIKSQTATISSWEKDYSTLKTLYKDSDAKAQEAQKQLAALEREKKDSMAHITEFKKRIMTLENENASLHSSLEKGEQGGRKSTGSTQQDDDDVDELEDADRKRLQHRIHQLETELFNVRKKWHSSERRRLTSPDSSPAFLDVDLNPAEAEGYGTQQQSHRPVENSHARETEEKMRRDTERIERVKDVKRGLVKWQGWRLDLTVVGGSGLNFGAMFEV